MGLEEGEDKTCRGVLSSALTVSFKGPVLDFL